jgi:hypothetical protein
VSPGRGEAHVEARPGLTGTVERRLSGQAGGLGCVDGSRPPFRVGERTLSRVVATVCWAGARECFARSAR